MHREPSVLLVMPPSWCLHMAYQELQGAPIEWTMAWIEGAFAPEPSMMFLSMDELDMMSRILTFTDPRSTAMPDGQKATELLVWVWLGMLRLSRGENDERDRGPDEGSDRGTADDEAGDTDVPPPETVH